MNDSFDSYLPIKWLKDGLVVAPPVRETSPGKLVRRGGFVRKRLLMAALAIGVSTLEFSVAAETAGVSNVRAFQLYSAARYDEHVVPPNYWEELVSAMRTTPRLPAQSTKFDPPAAF